MNYTPSLFIEIGLSPLARGTRPLRYYQARRPRFIPARAGNTSATSNNQRYRPVYPRSRGEHVSFVLVASPEHGLSPLARGTLAEQDLGRIRARFIPARAGNTGAKISGALARPVYPRSRGEHPCRLSGGGVAFGLSPLARGTRRAKSRRGAAGAVYPRSRGEHAR